MVAPGAVSPEVKALVARVTGGTPEYPGEATTAKTLPEALGPDAGFASGAYRTVTFVPGGEAAFEPEPGAQEGAVVLAGFGLQEIREAGGAAAQGKDAVVLLEGVTGTTRVVDIR
jgi:hypothetical protein